MGHPAIESADLCAFGRTTDHPIPWLLGGRDTSCRAARHDLGLGEVCGNRLPRSLSTPHPAALYTSFPPTFSITTCPDTTIALRRLSSVSLRNANRLRKPLPRHPRRAGPGDDERQARRVGDFLEAMFRATHSEAASYRHVGM